MFGPSLLGLLLEVLVLSWVLRQGCSLMWGLGFCVCVCAHAQLHFTASITSISVKDVILRVLVIWSQSLLQCVISHFVSPWELIWGGDTHGMLV